ncbi:hypothetical protein C2S52_000858 [Perilla frutescens var. hirtella]|nr:hypothetical protein C2S52_000858 [Perilla frutescens var. hirtella]
MSVVALKAARTVAREFEERQETRVRELRQYIESIEQTRVQREEAAFERVKTYLSHLLQQPHRIPSATRSPAPDSIPGGSTPSPYSATQDGDVDQLVVSIGQEYSQDNVWNIHTTGTGIVDHHKIWNATAGAGVGPGLETDRETEVSPQREREEIENGHPDAGNAGALAVADTGADIGMKRDSHGAEYTSGEQDDTATDEADMDMGERPIGQDLSHDERITQQAKIAPIDSEKHLEEGMIGNSIEMQQLVGEDAESGKGGLVCLESRNADVESKAGVGRVDSGIDHAVKEKHVEEHGTEIALTDMGMGEKLVQGKGTDTAPKEMDVGDELVGAEGADTPPKKMHAEENVVEEEGAGTARKEVDLGEGTNAESGDLTSAGEDAGDKELELNSDSWSFLESEGSVEDEAESAPVGGRTQLRYSTFREKGPDALTRLKVKKGRLLKDDVNRENTIVLQSNFFVLMMDGRGMRSSYKLSKEGGHSPNLELSPGAFYQLYGGNGCIINRGPPRNLAAHTLESNGGAFKHTNIHASVYLRRAVAFNERGENTQSRGSASSLVAPGEPYVTHPTPHPSSIHLRPQTHAQTTLAPRTGATPFRQRARFPLEHIYMVDVAYPPLPDVVRRMCDVDRHREVLLKDYRGGQWKVILGNFFVERYDPRDCEREVVVQQEAGPAGSIDGDPAFACSLLAASSHTEYKGHPRIPTSFLNKHATGGLRSSIDLFADSNNQAYDVRVELVDGDFCFTQGWQSFVVACDVHPNDRLTFRPICGSLKNWFVTVYADGGICRFLDPEPADSSRGEGPSDAPARLPTPRFEVPKKFIEETEMNPPLDVQLQDGVGLSMPARIGRRRNNTSVRFFITDGWREFARAANFFEREHVMFSFIRDAGNIIRVVPISPQEGRNLLSRAGNGGYLAN